MRFTRIIAALLLVMAGAEVYACDLADACVSSTANAPGGCDDPAGDNCICCCHHAVPTNTFSLEPGEVIDQEPPPQRALKMLTASAPIDHPPKL